MNLVAATPEQLDKYKDGSHRVRRSWRRWRRLKPKEDWRRLERRLGRRPRDRRVAARMERLM